jgi:hypothetical protein
MEAIDLKSKVTKIIKEIDVIKSPALRRSAKFKEFSTKVKALYNSIDKKLEDRPCLSELLFAINQIILCYNQHYSYFYNSGVHISQELQDIREYAQSKVDPTQYIFPKVK